MGVAVGYTVEQVSPFLKSLRNTGYSGSIVLFVDTTLARALADTPEASGVTLLKVPQWLPFRLGLQPHERMMRLLWWPIQGALGIVLRVLRDLPLSEAARLTLQRPLAQIAFTPMEARFLQFYHFLRRKPHSRILISDVRDVLFQADPFQDLPTAGLGVSIETSSYSIATEVHNAEWIKRAYGTGMLDQIGGNRVSCVGVTYGDSQSMMAYLRLMTGEMLKMSPRVASSGGADTAMHNVLIWTSLGGSIHQLETLRSPVATLNGVAEGAVQLSPDGRLLNLDGSKPSVVHQYDRVPGLRPSLLRALAS